MTVSVTIENSLNALDAEDWRRLGRTASPFQTREWFSNAPTIGDPWLILCRSRGRAVAALPIHVLQRKQSYYHDPSQVLFGQREREILSAAGFATVAYGAASAAQWFPAVVSVSPYGYRGGLLGDADEISPNITGLVVAALDGFCRTNQVRLAMVHYLRQPQDRLWLEQLSSHGFRTFTAGAHCVLQIRWRSMEEYFRSMGDRGRRLRASFRKQTAMAGWREYGAADEPIPLQLMEQAANLLQQSAMSHGEAEPPKHLYAAALEGKLGSRFLLTAGSAEGELRSVLLVIVHNKVFYPKFFGTRGARDDYFHLTYAWLISLALQQGIESIDYGGGSHQAKLLRGASLQPAIAALRIYDTHLSDIVTADFVRTYESAKTAFFSRLQKSYEKTTLTGQKQ